MKSEFRVGSLVRCVDNNNCDYLTLNKVYIILELTNDYIFIEDDFADRGGYWHSRFELVDSKAAEVLYGANNE